LAGARYRIAAAERCHGVSTKITKVTKTTPAFVIFVILVIFVLRSWQGGVVWIAERRHAYA
jgi:hypothetical protein